MKKLTLLIVLALFIQFTLSAQFGDPCLPDGIWFFRQSQIDNFQTSHPNCTEIEGNVRIATGDDEPDVITNLDGLSVLNSIGGNLKIQNNSLTSLTGLDNVTSIGGQLLINNNPTLLSLTGLDNIDAESISSLFIYNNPSLNTCEVQSICNYLVSPNGIVEIHSNAPGCNSTAEVASACGITLPCLPYGNYYFFTQNEIDNFQTNYPGCMDLEGNVTISGDDITNLNGLSVLTSIGGILSIGGNNALSGLTGLDNVTSIGESLEILNNNSLTSLTGLDNLTSIVNNLIIGGNDVLSGLTGLNNVTNIGGNLAIGTNAALQNLTGLENLAFVDGNLLVEFYGAPTTLIGLENLDSIGGDLLIKNNNSLTSLTGLEGLTSITGDLKIGVYPDENNLSLTSLTGLDNLTSIGGQLLIYKNFDLTSLTGLDNLTTIGSDLDIRENVFLANLSGLENLTSIGSRLDIRENVFLANLSGLDNVTSIGRELRIYNNYAMTSLSGLDNVTSIGGELYIGYNDDLTSLSGLDNVTSIGGSLRIHGNDSLESLTGLDNIDASSISYLSIYYNPSLTTCEVQSICDYLGSLNVIVKIHSNAPGCNTPGDIASSCGFTMPCLPYGEYYFTRQMDIDSFPVHYQNCTYLSGDVTILGDDITSMEGLNEITSVEGNLMIIGNELLNDLTGLDNLNTIGGSLSIGNTWYNNPRLTNLTGLEGLTSIVGGLSISNNDSLTSLTGLDNLNTIGGSLSIGNVSVLYSNPRLTNLTGLEGLTSLGVDLKILSNNALTSMTGLDNVTSIGGGLYISHNDTLRICEVQSICDYLVNPAGSIFINNNAPGCNNKEEVEAACELVSVDDISLSDKLFIFPNPSSTKITIELPNTPQKNAFLTIYNISSQQLLMSKITKQKTVADISGLPTGFYFLKVTDDKTMMVGKLVKK